MPRECGGPPYRGHVYIQFFMLELLQSPTLNPPYLSPHKPLAFPPDDSVLLPPFHFYSLMMMRLAALLAFSNRFPQVG